MPTHRLSQDLLWGALFFLKKLMRFFSRRPQCTLPKTAKLTTPTLQTSPTSKKIHKKLTYCSAWDALPTYPYKLRLKIFLALRGACAFSASPGYAYGLTGVKNKDSLLRIAQKTRSLLLINVDL